MFNVSRDLHYYPLNIQDFQIFLIFKTFAPSSQKQNTSFQNITNGSRMAKNSSDFHDLQIRILQDFKDFDNITAKITTFSEILKIFWNFADNFFFRCCSRQKRLPFLATVRHQHQQQQQSRLWDFPPRISVVPPIWGCWFTLRFQC